MPTTEPATGGDVRVSVSGWAGWNVWLDVETYHDPDRRADVALQPREAARIAAHLLAAALICTAKRLPGQVRRMSAGAR
ncbi:hypothetical protein [Umezawaea beigongshangensis]|uniref:hypothetical protein n=1 Tax=Umezawaea beigongshangensis TaxID=2780383 RepID=UPI0018F225D9|nr:hypothetical protein [Umezawaea beigongshangensis]